MTLGWDASAGPLLGSYDGFGSAMLVQTIAALGWTDATTGSDEEFSYWIVAVNAKGSSSASVPATATREAGGAGGYLPLVAGGNPALIMTDPSGQTIGVLL